MVNGVIGSVRSKRGVHPTCARQRTASFFIAGVLSAAAGYSGGAEPAPSYPNILFISVDDMRDWTEGLGGYAGAVHTPNMTRLAARGVAFTNAHAPSPVCGPSRASIMLGLLPSTTGLYRNNQWWKPHVPNRLSIPEFFKTNGYHTVGAGKVHHHTAGFNPPAQWHEFQELVFHDDSWTRDDVLNYPWSSPTETPGSFPFSGVPSLSTENDWGILPGKPEGEYDDARSVDYAIRYLSETDQEPFFLACGIFRPHLPWYVPQKYFDLYPIDSIIVPEAPLDDLDDLPPEALRLAAFRRDDLMKIQEAGKVAEAVQAYLASITFADAQLGRLLDALEASPAADNTIVVLWSDHGWHLGEKQHWHKFTLWEASTRVPFIWAGPGIEQGGVSAEPVNLLDIYPTLIELGGMEAYAPMDGQSLAPLLRDTTTRREEPAIMDYIGHFAVRSHRWRYIRYADGGEELYDHDTDPQEWTNLAPDPQYRGIMDEHAAWIPRNPAPEAPVKSAYDFDPVSYTWTHRETGEVTNGYKPVRDILIVP
jgi:choline-sulfatase